MQAFANNIKNKENLEKNAETIREKLYETNKLVNEKGKFLFDGRYNSKNDVQARTDYYNNFLQDYISSK